MKNIIISFLIVILFLVSGFFIFQNYSLEVSNKNIEQRESSFIKIKEQILNVELALTAEQRSLGLSNREVLAENTGMLFVFPTPGKYFFWMKDMNFPIDMIWFDENRKIIYIEKNVQPDSFPKLFGEDKNSLYVLEINSGFAEKHDLKVGDEFSFIEN